MTVYCFYFKVLYFVIKITNKSTHYLIYDHVFNIVCQKLKLKIVGKVLLKIFVYLFMENNKYMLQSKMVYCLIETVLRVRYSRLCHPGCARGKGSVQSARAGPPRWRESARSTAAAGRAAHSV